jgi:serine phosphatase RsbU (regulator of sigma subunit)
MAAGGITERVGTPCPPAGVLPEITPTEEERWLAPGDTVVVYTDGYALPGLHPPESVELALGKCKRDGPNRLLEQMFALLSAELAPSGPRDDVALLALQVTGADKVVSDTS